MPNDVTFAYPWMLLLLAIVPAMIFWYWKVGRSKEPSITYSSLKIFQRIPLHGKKDSAMRRLSYARSLLQF